jgi:PAS domain S-box-containing protein
MHDVNPELTAEVMSAMLAASPDCIKILSAGGDILYVNARGAELMQLDRVDDLIGLNYLDLWLAHDHERIAGAIKQAAAGETVRFEACCHNAKNELKCWEVSLAPFHTNGIPTRIVGISRDISDHRQSKIALSVSENERLEAELRHQALSARQTMQTSSKPSAPSRRSICRSPSKVVSWPSSTPITKARASGPTPN